jgi:hypothetical protein
MTPEKIPEDVVTQCTVIEKISKAVNLVVSELIETRKSRPSLSVVALLARNLLELRVWTEFCTKSAKDAKTLYLDAVRDVDDLIRCVSSVDVNLYPGATDMIKKYADLRVELDNALEPGEMDGTYQKVNKAAKQIGLRGFEMKYKILSKFTHATSLTIMVGQLPDERYTLTQDALIASGLEMGSEAATIGKDFIEEIRNRFPQ